MREIHAAFNGDVIFPTDTPCRAGKVTEAVDRDDSCFLEGRNVECRREMREVMLDIVECGANAVAGKCLGEELGHLLPSATVS